jgi:hypothetical protein
VSDSLSFKYTLTEGDYARAWRIHSAASRLYIVFWLVIGGFIAVLLLDPILAISEGEPLAEAALRVFLPVAVFTALVWFSFSWRPRYLARQSRYRGLELDVTASDTGIALSNELVRSEISWDAYTQAVEKPDMFLLYTGRLMFYPVPKRAFASPQDVERFRALIRTHVPRTRLRDGPNQN